MLKEVRQLLIEKGFKLNGGFYLTKSTELNYLYFASKDCGLFAKHSTDTEITYEEFINLLNKSHILTRDNTT